MACALILATGCGAPDPDVGDGPGVGPALVAEPARLDFGDVALGVEATRTVTLRNLDDAPVSISSVEVAGGAFSLNGRVRSFTLSPDQARELEVSFAPAEAEHEGVLRVTSDAAADPLEVPLTGSGFVEPPCDLEVLPPRISVGAVSDPAELRVRDVLLANRNASGACRVVAVTVDATNAAVFVELPPGAIPAGGYALASFGFAPLDPEAPATARVSFHTLNPDSLPAELEVSYAAPTSVPAVLTPTEHDFGVLAPGGTASTPLCVENVGDEALLVSDVRLESPTTGPPAFSFAPDLAGETVPVGESLCTTLAFAPGEPGEFLGALVVRTESQEREVPYDLVATFTGAAETTTSGP